MVKLLEVKQHSVTIFDASTVVILKGKKRARRPKLVEDAELEALLDEDLCQMQEELA